MELTIQGLNIDPQHFKQQLRYALAEMIDDGSLNVIFQRLFREMIDKDEIGFELDTEKSEIFEGKEELTLKILMDGEFFCTSTVFL